MVARACKTIFNDKLRKIVYHFKSIEASKIDEEIQTFIINLFQTVLGNSQKAKNVKYYYLTLLYKYIYIFINLTYRNNLIN